VLSGRGLCDELITRPEESYRLCCVVVCDLETSTMGAPYIYDISRLRVKRSIIRSLNTVFIAIGIYHTAYVDCLLARSLVCLKHVGFFAKIMLKNNASRWLLL